MRGEKESLYDNRFLESIRNNQEIRICRKENTPETPLTESIFLPSENIVNIPENLEYVLPVSVNNYRTKLDNY